LIQYLNFYDETQELMLASIHFKTLAYGAQLKIQKIQSILLSYVYIKNLKT